MRAIIYARSATVQEHGSNTVLPIQIETLSEYAEEKGYEVVPDGILGEIVSGMEIDTPMKRKVYELALSHSFDVLLLYSYDRLCRNTALTMEYIAKLQEHGIEIESFTEKVAPEVFAFLKEVQTFQSEIEKVQGRKRRGKSNE